jgi:glucose/arabinose dehydrogenase
MEANTMKTIALLLITVLALNGCGFALQTSPRSASLQTQTNEAKQAANAKAEVQKRGVGEQSRVRVSLRDGTEVKGYISKVEENSFEVTDRKSGKVVAISYDNVEKVKGSGLSRPAEIAIGVGIVVGVVGGIFLAVLYYGLRR